MSEGSHRTTDDQVELGVLLVLLHDADAPLGNVHATYRIWRHEERLKEAFLADAEEQRRRGASISTISTTYRSGSDEPEPTEREETVEIWREGERFREEHHGGQRGGYYAIADGPLWWMWDERMGAMSNQDDPSVGSGVGQELEVMLNPTPLLSSLRFRVAGSSQVAGRATITAYATSRPEDPRYGRSPGLGELGTGAHHYQLEVDQERGVLLAVTAIRDEQPLHKITTLAIRFNEQIPAETFQFKAPEGEEIQRLSEPRHVQHVTLTEAQQRAPFTVLMPDRVPASWQMQADVDVSPRGWTGGLSRRFLRSRSGTGSLSRSRTAIVRKVHRAATVPGRTVAGRPERRGARTDPGHRREARSARACGSSRRLA